MLSAAVLAQPSALPRFDQTLARWTKRRCALGKTRPRVEMNAKISVDDEVEGRINAQKLGGEVYDEQEEFCMRVGMRG
jgi:hypothetical protein